jgi:hypothetical protein
MPSRSGDFARRASRSDQGRPSSRGERRAAQTPGLQPPHSPHLDRPASTTPPTWEHARMPGRGSNPSRCRAATPDPSPAPGSARQSPTSSTWIPPLCHDPAPPCWNPSTSCSTSASSSPTPPQLHGDDAACWYIDLVSVTHSSGRFQVWEQYLDVIVPTDGRPYRMLDLDESPTRSATAPCRWPRRWMGWAAGSGSWTGTRTANGSPPPAGTTSHPRRSPRLWRSPRHWRRCTVLAGHHLNCSPPLPTLGVCVGWSCRRAAEADRSHHR